MIISIDAILFILQNKILIEITSEELDTFQKTRDLCLALV